MSKRVLVVGSTSWLGRNFISQCPEEFEIERIDREEEESLNYKTYRKSNYRPDFVIIFAVDYCNENVANGINFNVNIIGELISFYIKESKVIFISSFFAKNLNLTDNLPYSCSKALIEQRFIQDSKFLSIRLEHVYGWNDLSGKLIPFVIRSSVEKNTFMVKSDGIKRDFVWYMDVIDGILRLMNNTEEHGIVEFGTGKSVSVRKVVEVIASHINKSVKVTHLMSSSNIVESKSTEFLSTILERPLVTLDEAIKLLDTKCS